MKLSPMQTRVRTTKFFTTANNVLDVFDKCFPGFRQMTNMFPGTGPDETLTESIGNMIVDELRSK